MAIIDLPMPLDSKTPAYPGDPLIQIEQIAELRKNGWNEKRLHLNSHCGTHIDAPSHFVEKGKTIDQLPLDLFQGDGVLIDVRKKQITVDLLKGVKPNAVVLFLT